MEVTASNLPTTRAGRAGWWWWWWWWWWGGVVKECKGEGEGDERGMQRGGAGGRGAGAGGRGGLGGVLGWGARGGERGRTRARSNRKHGRSSSASTCADSSPAAAAAEFPSRSASVSAAPSQAPLLRHARGARRAASGVGAGRERKRRRGGDAIRVRALTPQRICSRAGDGAETDRGPTGRRGRRSDAIRGRMLIRGLHFAGDAAMVAGMPLPEREHALEMCGRTPS